MATHILIEVIIFGFLSSLGAGEDKIIYVVPSLNAPCLHSPLSQLATNTSYFDDISTNLVFLKGNHTLDSNFVIANVSKFVLRSESSTLQTRIICYQNASFSFASMYSLLVEGLVFTGCGNNMIMSVNRLVIDNSSFIGLNGTGTALKIIKTNASIVNSYFSANMLGSRCLIPFEDHRFSPFVGGAIIAYLSNVTIENSSFIGNRANLGAATFGYYSNISIISSNFADNLVIHYN
ncbi:MAG: hypothetical protein MJE68_21025, partial [Proteobacteria bacterium]|nr:hypothetical protein [Pseudomonadota bacterium]